MKELLVYLFEVVGTIAPFLGVWVLLNFLNKRNSKDEGKSDSSSYTIKSNGIVVGIMIVAFIFFTGCLICAYIDHQLDLFVLCGFGVFILVSFAGTLNTVIWKVEVRDKDIIYRSTFGIVRKYQFSDISKGIYKRSGALRIYIAEKRIFTFDSNMDFNRFREQMKSQRIPIYDSIYDSKRKKKRW